MHVETIKTAPILKELTPDQLDEFLAISKRNSYGAEERIISEGSYDNSLYFILSGQVKVYRSGPHGTALELCRLKAGEFFGELTLFDNSPRSASIATITETDLLYIERHPFFGFLQKYPDVFSKMLKELSTRFRTSNDAFFGQVIQKNEELESAYQRLKTLDEQKSKFIALTSHEIRTPLSIMMNSLAFLEEGMGPDLPPAIKKNIEIYLRSARKLKDITDRIIDVAVGGDFDFMVKKTNVNLSDLIKTIYNEDLVPRLAKRDLNITTTVPTDLSVNADIKKLRQIIFNVLTNAIRFTPDGGNISVFAQTKQQGWVSISVEDSGIGIPEDRLELVFSPFYKVGAIEHHTSGDVEFGSGGIGLGLSIAKNFAELHHGRIDVRSQLDKGSTFTIHLPKS